MNSFYSNGKLLITAEYLVLDGACALAVPTKFGQSLKVSPIDEPKIIWKSFDDDNSLWFSVEFDINSHSLVSLRTSDTKISKRLIQILSASKQLNPDFLRSGFEVETYLDFPRNWGLGTSSTLINNIANWAQIDAFKLLDLTFGGSGYDIACAQHDSVITYQLENDEMPRQAQHDNEKRIITKADFNPVFSDNLFFIHLNKKQDSRQGIAQYNSKKRNLKKAISEISNITKRIIDCQSLSDFETLINQHETIISNILGIPTVKHTLFNDYKGAVKSLGAWGGDFVLATGTQKEVNYFKNKGYSTIINYNDMVL